jgi:hypothetical protein
MKHWPCEVITMGRASEQALSHAHGYLLEVTIEQIEQYRQEKIISPTTGQAMPVPPALLATLAQMLRTNGVDRPEKDKVSEADDELSEELDEFEAAGNVSPFSGKTTKAPPANIKPVKRTAKQRREAIESDAEKRLARVTQAACSGCGTYHPREAFDRNRARASGLQSNCKKYQKEQRARKKAEKAAAANEAFKADQSTSTGDTK